MGASSCKIKKPEMTDGFDRAPLLDHYAKDIIRPAYYDLQLKNTALNTAIQTLIANPTEVDLVKAQQAWIEAYSDFQYVSLYNFGPAAEQGVEKTLSDEIGVFPVTESKIEMYIANNDVSFNNFDRDSRGYLALEYLLFDVNGNNAAIITLLSNANRKAYLQAAMNQIQQKVDKVYNAWSTYEAEFIASTGADAGSSISELFNKYLLGYEVLKNYQVGLPAGLRAGQTASEPTKVAGYYSGRALDFVKSHYKAVEYFWYGKSKSGIDGVGFEEYLQNVEGGQALIDQTKAQFTAVQSALDAVPTNTSLSNTIINNKQPVDNLYLQLSALTRFIKSDMSSLLGIYITYASGDGD